MEDSSFQFQPRSERVASSREKSGKSKKILAVVVAVAVIGLLGFGATRFIGNNKEETAVVNPTPTEAPEPTGTPIPTETPKETPTPTLTPTNTPAPKPTVNPIDRTTGLNRSKLSIHVFNGSGTSGASKVASDYLEGLGYNIIQIGNAANFDYTKTSIQVKSAKSDFLNLLKKDLSSKYSVGSASADLADSERPDAFVIVGKE